MRWRYDITDTRDIVEADRRTERYCGGREFSPGRSTGETRGIELTAKRPKVVEWP